VTFVFYLNLCGVPFVARARGGDELDQIVTLIEEGRLRDAESRLQDVLRTEPNSGPAYRLLGILHRREGKFAQAEADLEKAVKLGGGKDPQTLFLLAQIKFAVKKTQEALDLAAQVSTLDASDPSALYAVGRLLRENSLAEEAAKELDRAGSLAPQNPAIATELILAELDCGRAGPAEALLGLFVATAAYDDLVQAGSRFAEAGRFAVAVRAFERAVDLQPKSYDALYDLALADYRVGDLAKTLATLDRIKSLNAEPPADYHYLRGKAELDLGQALAAGEELSKAVEQQPDNESLCVDTGLLFFRHENFWKALEVYEKCSGRQPDSVAVETGLGLTYFRLGKYDGAIRTFKRVLALRADADAAREGLAFLFYVSGNLSEARTLLEQRLGTEDADYYSYYLHALVLLRLEARANRAAALQSLDNALRRNPRFAPACFQTGKILAEKGDLEGALKDLRRATELDPAYAQPYYLMAQIEFKLGRKDEAEQARLRFAVLDREKEEKDQKQQVENRLLQALQ
jgi:tetratricopeptide (TPR) repeat protein